VLVQQASNHSHCRMGLGGYLTDLGGDGDEVLVVTVDDVVELVLEAVAILAQLLAQRLQRAHAPVLGHELGARKDLLGARRARRGLELFLREDELPRGRDVR
jgi:hypothetical protein